MFTTTNKILTEVIKTVILYMHGTLKISILDSYSNVKVT